MKSSFHSRIPFLPLFCNCQFRRLDSIQFLCSQAHILAGWLLEALDDCQLRNSPNKHLSRTTRKIQRLYCLEGVFTAPLHSNGCYSIVACVYVAAVMCLPSRCLAMNVYSDVAIPASGRHVTVLYALSGVVKT
jgi:hypothetical protein